jgi:hypothetical protein
MNSEIKIGGDSVVVINKDDLELFLSPKEVNDNNDDRSVPMALILFGPSNIGKSIEFVRSVSIFMNK